MEPGDVIIETTPFIFEDGNTYYFQIVKREHSNDYHDIYVYEKIKEEKKYFWGGVKVNESFKQINKNPELISTNLDTNEIKRQLKKILIATKARHQLKNWDGFVGNIPDEVKTALKRENRLKDILGV